MGDAAARLVEALRSFYGDDLRDFWVFDHHRYEHLHVKEDVSDTLERLNISQSIDNERFGCVTRDTYETLYYADYDYTVRGFDSLGQFRTFIGDHPIGILTGFGRGAGHDFVTLHDRVYALNGEFDGADLFSDPTTRDRLP